MLFRSRYLYKFYNYYGRRLFVLDMFQFQKKWYWFTANLGPEDGLMAFFSGGLRKADGTHYRCGNVPCPAEYMGSQWR